MNKLESFLHKNDIDFPIITIKYIIQETIHSMGNIISNIEYDDKELDSSINYFSGYIIDLLSLNYIPYTQKIPAINEKGMTEHYMTHIILYFLNKKGFVSIGNNEFKYSKDNILILYSKKDKMGFIYDLYIMFLYNETFETNIFNHNFIINNKNTLNNIKDNICINELQKGIVNDNISIVSKNDEKEFLLLEQMSDLLGLLDTGFKQDFTISSKIFSQFKIEKGLYNLERQGAFIIPIIYIIFGRKKNIKVTKDNYIEIKTEFVNARIKYLNELGVNDKTDKKEIRDKINEKIDKLKRINTKRAKHSKVELNKKRETFNRKISLLTKKMIKKGRE